MTLNPSAGKWAAAAALVLISAAANAALSVYTTAGSFAAATLASATDTFAGIPNDNIASPSARSAGSYAYSVSAPGGLYGSGTTANPWMSTKLSGDTLTFSGFSSAVQAIGGLFFGADFADDFLPGQTITLTATDSLGATVTRVIADATQSSFLGFTSTGSLVSLAVDVGLRSSFMAVDSVVLAQAAPIPEPETYALFLAGLGALGAALRRRKSVAGAAPAA